MATIRKRGSRYNVQIRKEGYPYYYQDVYPYFSRQEVADGGNFGPFRVIGRLLSEWPGNPTAVNH